MADLAVQIGSLTFRNPVLAASGTFGYGLAFEGLVDLEALGGIVFKSLTVEPRAGNPAPRIAETPSGLLNSIGLENPGLQAFLDDVLPRAASLPTARIASIAGESVGDFETLAGALDPHDALDALEVNVSCPNQEAGGMTFGVDPALTARVTAAVRRCWSRTLIVKLTPNVTDMAPVAQAAEAEGADAVALVNTFQGLAVDWRRRRPAIHGIEGRGGLSGPAVKPMALRFVHDVYKAVGIPVVGMGGIVTAGDAMEFVVAGASAVQVGTAHFMDPKASEILARDLEVQLDGTPEPILRRWIGALRSTFPAVEK